jgi:hypothetical protein
MADSNPRAEAVLNTKELAKLASALLSEVTEQKNEHATSVATITSEADKLFDGAVGVGRAHSGSNFGYHGALYYRGFEVPPLGSMFNVEWGGIHGIPPGWTKREPEEVKIQIERTTSATFASLEKEIKVPLDFAKRLHKEILIQLAPLHQLSDGNKERQLLDNLEHFDWKDSAHNKYAASAMQGFPNMTRDSGAITQGCMFPAHSYYEAAAAQLKESCSAIEEFWNSAERLLRQLQLGATQTLVTRTESDDGPTFAEKYERLKIGALLLAAFLSSLLLTAAAELAIRKWQWRWLLDHPNSYSIQWLTYAVLLLFLIGLFVRKFRNYCWGIALVPLLVGVLQSLGGPPHSP